MLVRAALPHVENQVFTLLIPKTLGTADQVLMNFPATPVNWTWAPEESVWHARYAELDVVDFQARLTAGTNSITMSYEVRNDSDHPWQDVWIFTFLAPQGGEDYRDTRGERTYIPLDGQPTLLSTLEWPSDPEGNPDHAVFPFKGRQSSLPALPRGLHAESPHQPTAGWMLTMNEEGDAFAALLTPNPLFLFRNRDLSSLHVAPLLGDLAPGQTGSATVIALFGAADTETALETVFDAYARLKEQD
jgi:hypothetical protein